MTSAKYEFTMRRAKKSAKLWWTKDGGGNLLETN